MLRPYFDVEPYEVLKRLGRAFVPVNPRFSEQGRTVSTGTYLHPNIEGQIIKPQIIWQLITIFMTNSVRWYERNPNDSNRNPYHLLFAVYQIQLFNNE